MGRTTKILIQKLWDKKSKKRALGILLFSDLCLFLAGSYLIVSWIRMNEHDKLNFFAHEAGLEEQAGRYGEKPPGTRETEITQEPETKPNESEKQPETDETEQQPKPDKSELKKEQQNFLLLVHSVLGKQTQVFERCYAKAFKPGSGTPTGSVYFRFRLKKDGQVDKVSIQKNTTGLRGIEDCLLGAASKIRFPKPPKGAREFLYPLSFSAQ